MDWIGRLYPFLRKAIPAFILVGGIGISYFALREAQHFDGERVRNSLELRATLRTRDIEGKFLDATVPVESLATFISTQKNLDPSEFHGFAVTARGVDPIIRLTWTPLVSNDQRVDFEVAARQTDANPDYAISDLDSNGRLIPAAARDEYLPIRFEQIFDDIPSLMGFDRLSEPLRRAAVERARDAGTPIFTSLLPSTPELEKKTPPRLVLAWPAYRGGQIPVTVGERRAMILGYVTGSFAVEDLLVFALRDTPALVETLTLFVGSPPGELLDALAVRYSSASGKVEAGGESLGQPNPDGLRLTKSFYQFGQNWTLVFDFSPEVLSGIRSPAPWGYLGIGLVLTLALTIYLYSLRHRQSAVEALIAERTKDLYRTSAQLRGMIESSPLASGCADADRRIIVWNRAAEQLFGYSAEEVVGTINFFAPPDEEAQVVEFARRLLGGEVFRGVESRNMRKDQTVFESAISAAAFHDSQGNPQGIVFSIEDISDRKQREAAERETTERLQAIVDTAVDGIIMIDGRGAALMFNPAAERLFGYHANEVLGRNIKMLMPPPFADEHDRYLGDYHDSGQRKIIGTGRDVIGRRKDGTTFPMHLSVGEAKQQGRPIFVGVVRDLTTQRESEDVLRQTQVLLSGIVESSHDAIISKSLDGIVTSWNSAAARIFGFSAEEMIGHHISILSVPGHEDLAEILETIGRGERIEDRETQRRHQDGSVLDVTIAVSPIYDAQNKIIGASEVARDISETKKSAAAIRKHEELYRATYQQAPVGIAFVDLDFRYVHVNDLIAASDGFKAADMVGRKVSEIIPDIWDSVEPIMRRVIASGEPVFNVEVVGRALTSAGRERHELVSYQPVRIFGEIVGVSVTAIDITDRKAAETELRRSREHLARVQRVARIGSAEIDLVTQEAVWSEELYELLGIAPGDVGTNFNSFAALIHPDDRTLAGDLSVRGRRGEQTPPGEFRVVRPDGEIRWFYRQADFTRDSDGHATRLIATMYDITERKVAAEALRQSQEHLAQAQRVGSVGSAEIDLRTGKVFWSDQTYRLLGLDSETTIPSLAALLTVIPPEDRERDRQLAGRIRLGHDVDAFEFRIIRPDGQERWIFRTTEIIRNRDGAPMLAMTILQDVTDRRHLVDDLRRSQEHLARVQNVAHIGSTEVDLETGEVTWSDEIYRMLGIGHEPFIPGVDSFAAAIHPDDRALVRDVSLRGRRGEEAGPVEFRMIGPDGVIRWFYRKADFIRDAAGRPTRLIATIYDVTERKLAEEAGRHSQEHLVRVQHVAHIGSTELNLDTGDYIWSEEVYRLLGLQQLTTVPTFDEYLSMIHPDDRSTVREASRRARAGEEMKPSEFRVIMPDHEVRWLYSRSDFARATDGHPTRLISTVYDITDRKIAENARRASEEQYRLTFDMAPVGIAHVSLEGQFLVVNDTLCTMFGTPRDQMLSVNYRVFTHPDDIDESEQYVRRLILGSEPSLAWEKRFIRSDGSIIWCHLTSTLDRDDSGQVTHFITVYEDITARKDAEIRRSQLEEQLQQSQKMEAVGRLTGGVAHDFNNLLTIILINLELVLERVTNDPKLTRQIESALGAGRRGADLTQRLLAFSRRQPLAPVVVDINKSITELVPLLARTIGETITVKQTLSSSLWSAVVDPSQFESAIMNLAVNARDAMPNGGLLEIKTDNIEVDDVYTTQRPGLSTGRYVRVSVTDTGTGMPPEVAAQAFEPFFTTKEVGKGTGLGLSMIYGFTKQSGGHTSIYSEVGLGTTVTVLLPADPQGRTANIGPLTVPAAGTAGSETILVVEDDPEVRRAAVSLLDALGYQTLEAGTVREGLVLFTANPHIDLVLTDVILPEGEDGAELARRARALRPDAKILFMSGYTEDIVMHDGRLDAGVMLLQKPFTRTQLAAKVRAAIDGVVRDHVH